jgi:large subunit ribosomal protein L30
MTKSGQGLQTSRKDTETVVSRKKKEQPAPEKTLQVTLVRSPIGFPERQKRTVRALGLRRLNQTVVHVDGPTVRGMISRVSHLVRVEENEA